MVVKDDEVAPSLEIDPAGQRAQVRRAALVFPHLFFPASTPYAGAMASFATYAVGFVARPLGAAIFGHWGDRIGRKATLIVTLLVMGISSAIVGVLPGLQYGPQAALIAENFPTHLRYGGAGLGYQLASVFAGGPAPLIATWLLHKTGTPYAISAYIVFAAIVTVACGLALPNRSRVDIDDAAVYLR